MAGGARYSALQSLGTLPNNGVAYAPYGAKVAGYLHQRDPAYWNDFSRSWGCERREVTNQAFFLRSFLDVTSIDLRILLLHIIIDRHKPRWN